ncbi:4F2 cell-surface antigen heavy chain [Cuculus canorus]|uniref:4F2 cell-surface antigen heavy chain n=1 Tax=Cuculus canorus TaxID=55661 RepID=UPI0023AB496E|nr:4F2 cell-surface antigen heavy chain [Cuculus canorus]
MEAEAPPRALELSALEAEKQPMAAEEEERAPQVPLPAEKNGLVKVGSEEEGLGRREGISGGKFTGLGKEELLRAAESPPWKKARAVLLLVFWLGWLGMLGAAAAIVARAPRCRPLPPRAWWEMGALYRAPPKAFAGELKGVAQRLEHVAGLQVRGLVLGPLHPQIPGGDPKNLSLDQLDPQLGTLQDFQDLLSAARKRGLQVLVDVTPNPGKGSAWMGAEKDPQFLTGVTRALNVWLERGVSGFFIDGIEELPPTVLAEWRNLTERQRDDGIDRVLLGGSRLVDAPRLRSVMEESGLAVVLGRFLEALSPSTPPDDVPQQLLQFLLPETKLAWAVGSPWAHMASLSPHLTAQRLLLLWALPGTPVISYGDEIGLRDPPEGGQEPPEMPWELIDSVEEGNETEAQWLLGLCRRLGALRLRERSLAMGDAIALSPIAASSSPIAASSSPTAASSSPIAALLRRWDQSERFLLVLNPTAQAVGPLELRDPRLPHSAALRLSTHLVPTKDPQVDLGALQLLPYEGLLLSFPPDP